jgi:hypothetical protein
MNPILAIENLLEALSAKPQEDRPCPHCGAAVSHLGLIFWLDGAEKAWDVLLPVCYICASRDIPKKEIVMDT